MRLQIVLAILLTAPACTQAERDAGDEHLGMLVSALWDYMDPKQLEKVSACLQSMKAEGRLTETLIEKVIVCSRVYGELLQCLERDYPALAETVYVKLLTHPPRPLPDEVALSLARGLAALRDDCTNDALFQTIGQVRSRSLDTDIHVAKAFVKTRPSEVESWALRWTRLLRQRPLDHTNCGDLIELNELLAQIGTPRTLAELWGNLKHIGDDPILGAGPAVRLLGEAKYKPALDHCLGLARTGPDELRAEAVRAAANIAGPDRRPEVLKVAREVRAFLAGNYPSLVKQVEPTIEQLTRAIANDKH